MPDCEECTRLIALYREAANTHKEAVERSFGTAGQDVELACRIAAELAHKCRQANDIFLRHVRDRHSTNAA